MKYIVGGCGALLAVSLQGCGGPSTSGRVINPTPKPVMTSTTTTSTTTTTTVGHDHQGKDIAEERVRAVTYRPMYVKDQSCLKNWSEACNPPFPTDDFAAEWAERMWADDGRGDLQNIRSIGANAVRLYGNDPHNQKEGFVQTATSNDLMLVSSISNYWYNQQGGPLCALKNGDCHDTIKDAFTLNLKNGFLDEGYYANAITVINLMEKPDWLGDTGDKNFLKAMISAFDGLLSAEKSMAVKPWKNGKLPRITATWSWATTLPNNVKVCDEKYFIEEESECGPSLSFMVAFRNALRNSNNTVGYEPVNDLVKAFEERWVNSLDGRFDANAMRWQFLDRYSKSSLKDMPVYIAAWRQERLDAERIAADLAEMENLSGDFPVFKGASFCDYQTNYAYNEWEKLNFGLFGLGDAVIDQTGNLPDNTSHPIQCLVPHPALTPIVQNWQGSQPTAGLCADLAASVMV